MIRRIGIAAAALLVVTALSAYAQDEDLGPAPDGVQMLMQRGGIPAIFNPMFVPAAQAEIPDSAWVLGVFLDGVAKAYDLNLLNHHEVVNDVFGNTPAAPVW